MTRFGDDSILRRAADVIRAVVSRADPTSGPARRTLVIGHRGSPREEAENTIASFERALEQGADAIETDVCVTSDGHTLLWHDHDPDGILGIGRQSGREGFCYVPDAPRTGHDHRRPVSELDRATMERH